MADELKPLSEGPAMCLGGDYGTNFQSHVSSGNCSAPWFLVVVSLSSCVLT